MSQSLRDAFAERPGRFRLLEAGAEKAGWRAGARLLEIGCAGGEAAAYMAERFGAYVTGIDIDADAVSAAAKQDTSCVFLCGDACGLPFEKEAFDGIYSEAAFSVIPEKETAAAEYFRVLKSGGRVLLDDFALKTGYDGSRNGLEGIPCLKSVQTIERYREIFSNAGFSRVYEKEDDPEFIRMMMSLSKSYQVPPARIGAYLMEAFCGGNLENGRRLLSSVRMTYCQLIFERT